MEETTIEKEKHHQTTHTHNNNNNNIIKQTNNNNKQTTKPALIEQNLTRTMTLLFLIYKILIIMYDEKVSIYRVTSYMALIPNGHPVIKI